MAFASHYSDRDRCSARNRDSHLRIYTHHIGKCGTPIPSHSGSNLAQMPAVPPHAGFTRQSRRHPEINVPVCLFIPRTGVLARPCWIVPVFSHSGLASWPARLVDILIGMHTCVHMRRCCIK